MPDEDKTHGQVRMASTESIERLDQRELILPRFEGAHDRIVASASDLVGAPLPTCIPALPRADSGSHRGHRVGVERQKLHQIIDEILRREL